MSRKRDHWDEEEVKYEVKMRDPNEDDYHNFVDDTIYFSTIVKIFAAIVIPAVGVTFSILMSFIRDQADVRIGFETTSFLLYLFITLLTSIFFYGFSIIIASAEKK